MTMSTSPLLPNAETASPVWALTAIRRAPEVKNTRGGRFPLPGQNATPRLVGSPFFSS
jgi:hypothetical protein